MLEVIGESFASHLKGLAALLQAQGVNGDDIGVRGSVFWAWYRHEIWSCLLNERKMTLDETYWQPKPVANLDNMTQEEIANRITFIYGQAISFCNENSRSSDTEVLAARKVRLEALEAALANWRRKLPSWMVDFAMDPEPDGFVGDARRASQRRPFSSLWFIYPQSAIAHQVYHAAQIVLALHNPQEENAVRGIGRQRSLSLRRHIERSREQICSVASSRIQEEQAFISVQCLFVAGLVTEGKEERRQTLDVIEDCQRISGRRTVCIADELRKMWSLSLEE
ncbi:hypothetical protein LTS18_003139 [Coniosporium uncinatum]|uniref:Uncharacterized protein n=1 Tax=Coniosporium uncinatum TaxID=93489 RepID=A0ACC3DTN5_9PEZI|nr:hypothetical protein LTS18_003139 [Coniosporium uncinatum]